MRPSVPDVHITDAEDMELAAYRALAGQAVVGLIIGLMSPLALVDPLLYAIPVTGMLVSYWAIRRIKKSDLLTGRKIAIAGLLLSLVFVVAVPTDWIVYRRMVRAEARQFSSLWFQFVTHDQPQKAYQMLMPPQSRQRLNRELWAFYRNDPKQGGQLENYVKDSLVRTLLALGQRAEVRFFDTVEQSHDGNDDQVQQWYAVTYDEDGEKKSFFVAVHMLRQKLPDGQADWRILWTAVGVRPKGW